VRFSRTDVKDASDSPPVCGGDAETLPPEEPKPAQQSPQADVDTWFPSSRAESAESPAALASADTMDAVGDSPAQARPPGQPFRIGRHTIVERLGAGGMGIVYAAYDPELDRRIAIKLIRGSASPTASRRLQREAQAMAQVSHPNVIGVFDVGTHDGQVYVAMEYVAGMTLTDWSRRVPRSWREIVDVYVRAGRGLSAAHEAGLVHRDFKPENVMIGDDGRVRVMDFGLAHADETTVTQQDSAGLNVTDAGAIVGTPAYMSPEQFSGEVADARSDQFSFCVALWEALHDERPFPGETIGQLVHSLIEGKIAEPTEPGRAPQWVRDRLCRGMATQRDDRYPSIDALLAQLARDPARTRNRVAGGVGAICATVGITLAAVHLGTEDHACRGVSAQGEEVWNAARRRAVEQAFERTGVSYAADADKRVAEILDIWVTAWSTMRISVCEASRMRGETSERMMDLQMACLDRRLGDLNALIEVFEDVDPEMVEKAVQAAASLPTLDRCADRNALLAAVEPPDERAAAEVERIRAELSHVRALTAVGQYAVGKDRAEAAHRAATEHGYAPLLAETGYWVGVLQTRGGALDAAAHALQESFWAALESGHEEVAVDAATELVHVVGYRRADHDAGLIWGRHAEAIGARVTGTFTDPGRLSNNLASLRLGQGMFEQAEALQVRSIEQRREHLGEVHPEVANAWLNLGNILSATGAYDQAREAYDGARNLLVRLLGPTHPAVGMVETGLGNLESDRGAYEAARTHFERAREILEESLGPEHTSLGNVWLGIGYTHSAAQDDAAAERALRRALAIKQGAHGEYHREVAIAWGGLGELLQRTGRLDEAKIAYERALVIQTKLFGREHPDVAVAVYNLGSLAESRGDLLVAKERFTEALKLWEAAHGTDHPTLAHALAGLGRVAQAAGEPHDAVEFLERALLLLEKHLEPDSYYVSRTRFDLARVLAKQGTSSTVGRARELGDRALRGFVEIGDTEYQREIEKWIASLE
jgi:eukaryotic-like serine/threonine-protein kinase